jgi:hypothetical protein
MIDVAALPTPSLPMLFANEVKKTKDELASLVQNKHWL